MNRMDALIKLVTVAAVLSVAVALESKRSPVWRGPAHGSTAGSRPDLHWGDRDLFHGDFSVDESQFGGKVVVFKVRLKNRINHSYRLYIICIIRQRNSLQCCVTLFSRN